MFNQERTVKKSIALLATIIFISSIAAVCGTCRIPARLENYAEDFLYQRLDGISEDIKIIAIDDETLEALGPYSEWNRNIFADLINLLNAEEENRPRLIGVDIIFSGTGDLAEDAALTEAVSQVQNVVLASSLESDSELLKKEEAYYTRTFISNEYKPYPALAEVAEYGFTNVINDSDGVVRKAYTRIPPDHLSFAYLIASKLADVPDYHTREEVLYSVKPGEVEAISMARVLDGSVSASHFAGSVVLIGAYASGMLDSFKVPCDYSREMYGVEMQANYIAAFLHGRVVHEMPKAALFPLVLLLVAAFGWLAVTSSLRRSTAILAGSLATYPILAFAIFRIFSVKLPLLAVISGFLILYLGGLLYKYVELLKKREQDTQKMLFSMAESFAEAIEGRTPYNANHTKNVAKRCVEMLDYINTLHKEHKTELHFSENDKKQLYLAAMLHDVGKMDVPLEVMDKATKLGNKEEHMKDRLSIIMLKLQNDILTGRKEKEAAEKEIKKIGAFLENVGAYNCGRPLKEDEWAEIEAMEQGYYEEENGERIPYLTEEEKADLRIPAGTLSDDERTIMQSHVVYTDKILSHMVFGEQYKDVCAMASNHHELLNGQGYPKKLSDKDLGVMTRILTIMDIYDSLIAEDRPYKKPKSVAVAFQILDEEAKAGKVDAELLEYAKALYLKEKIR